MVYASSFSDVICIACLLPCAGFVAVNCDVENMKPVGKSISPKVPWRENETFYISIIVNI